MNPDDPVSPQQGDPILDRAKQLRAAGASIDQVKQYLTSKGYSVPEATPVSSKFGPTTAPDQTAVSRGLTGLAAHALNTAQGIPGMERAEALAGSSPGAAMLSGSPQLSYDQSLAALRGETNKIPAFMRVGEKMAGGALFGSALPLKQATTLGEGIAQGAKVGAGIGAADQAAAADPESLMRRGLGTVAGGIAGGAIGGFAGALPIVINKARDLMGLAKRVNESPTAGAQAVAQKNNMADVDAANFGRVNAQVAAHPTSPDVQDAFNHPTVKTFVDKVRNSQTGSQMSDAETAIQADQLMTAQRLGLKAAKITNPRETASINMELKDLNSGQKVLRTAISSAGYKPPITVNTSTLTGGPPGTNVAPNLIETEPHTIPGPTGTFGGETKVNVPGVSIKSPSMEIETAPPQRVPAVAAAYPKAVAGRAANEETAKQFGSGYVDAKRMMSNAPPAISNPEKVVPGLAAKSPEAFAQRISTMPPAEAEEYLRGVLAQAKEGITPKLSGTAFKTLTNLVAPARRLNNLSPFVRSLDVQAGRQPPVPLDVQGQINALLGVANTPAANP